MCSPRLRPHEQSEGTAISNPRMFASCAVAMMQLSEVKPVSIKELTCKCRSSTSNGGADGQSQRILKPSIYPKPPRQPGLDFSQTTSDIQRHNSYPSSQYDLQRQKHGLLANPRMNDTNSTSLSQGSVHSRRPSLSQFAQHHRGSDPQMRDVGRFPRSATGSRFSGSPFNEGSPINNAASALEMLSHLCSESHWEWIDGMLLGGCLAYGLGDYHKAMRWYSRIIARDST